MKRNLTLITCAFLVGAAALGSLAQGRRAAAVPLSDAAQAALVKALAGPDGEYAARAEYEAILAKFGADVLPYAHLIRAENNHVAALQQQCRRLGIPVPEDPYFGKVDGPDLLASAAEAGILAEKANIKMYDELLPAVQADPNLTQVFTRLRAASLDRHLAVLKLAKANGGTVTPATCSQAGCVGQPGNGGCCSQAGINCPAQDECARQAGGPCQAGLNCPQANCPGQGMGAGLQQRWRGGRR